MSDADSGSSDAAHSQSYNQPPANQKQKPKKKKKLPPQQAIDKIWSRFSAPRFSKATVVLPQASKSPKPAPPPTSRPNNLLVSEDFERAVQECRTKVRKLVKECKRVNMRYRDPTFDIDWDLKWEKGHCLNGLARDKFEVDANSLGTLSLSGPHAVKRVHEIFDKPTFLTENISPADVKQGNLGDCWLMSSLTGLANIENGIQRICVEYDTSEFPHNCYEFKTDRGLEIGIYGFVFHRGMNFYCRKSAMQAPLLSCLVEENMLLFASSVTMNWTTWHDY